MFIQYRFLAIVPFSLLVACWFLVACQPQSSNSATAVTQIIDVTNEVPTAVTIPTDLPTTIPLQSTPSTNVVTPTISPLESTVTAVAITSAPATESPVMESVAVAESPVPIATAQEIPVYWEDGIVYFDTAVILDIPAETGCFSDIAPDIIYSPNGAYLLIIPACFEGDNHLFLFQADGTGKLQLTSQFEYINFSEVEWAADSQSFTYTRINSCCFAPSTIPVDAPLPGRVLYIIETGEKILLTPPREFLVQVVNVIADDTLNVRAEAGVDTPIVGELPQGDLDIFVTGSGQTIGQAVWLPVRYQDLTGWVNGSYLVRQDR